MIPIRYGERGARVYEVQRTLKAIGLNPGALDGIYGGKTGGAIAGFQIAYMNPGWVGGSLYYTPGVVDDTTASALIRAGQRVGFLVRTDRLNLPPNTPLGQDGEPGYVLPDVPITGDRIPSSGSSWLALALAGLALVATTRL